MVTTHEEPVLCVTGLNRDEIIQMYVVKTLYVKDKNLNSFVR